MSRAGRFHALRTTLAAFGVLLLTWVTFETYGTIQGASLVDKLTKAEIGKVPGIVQEIGWFRRWTNDALRTLASEENEQSDSRLRASLAMLPVDSGQLPYLQDRLLSATPNEIDTLLTMLEQNKIELVGEMWSVARESAVTSSEHLLPAACALARFDAENDEQWSEICGGVAESLVQQNPLRLVTWMQLLRPARRQLVGSLSGIFAENNQQRPQSEIDLATELLEEYADDDMPVLGELIVKAQPKQLADLFDEFAAHPAAADLMSNALSGEMENVSTVPAAEWDEPLRIASGRRLANIATAQIRLAVFDGLLEIMQVKEDPEPLTQFVHRCRESGVASEQLVSTLFETERRWEAAGNDERAPLSTVLYGLVLALGEFELAELPAANRDDVVSRLAKWYGSHPSSAVHSATGWLLRRWGLTEEVLRVDHIELDYDASGEREWFVMKIVPTGGDNDNSTNSPVEPLYFTFIVFAPRAFLVGSPDSETDHQSSETLHQVTITRPIAVSDREITWEQFNAIDDGGHHDAWEKQFGKKLTPSMPAFGVSWFEAINYCRWLTEQARFRETSQCYEAKEDEDPRPGWVKLPDSTNWPVNLENNGFRLLTEAEWEYVCRAGTITPFGFGSDRSVLGKYAWYQDNSQQWSQPTGQLRPNLRGLFDIHGNLYEWCQDIPGDYEENAVDPVGADSGSRRVSRGGGWDYSAASCRSADRSSLAPSFRTLFLGFRLALSPSGVGPEAAADR